MAGNYMGNMTFGVNFKVDTKGLSQIEDQFIKIDKSLANLGNQADKSGNKGLKEQLDQAQKSANQLYDALMKSYNIKLGQFDISKLNTELAKSKTNLSSVAGDLSKVGLNINSIYSTLLNSKVMIKESNQFLDKMAVTFGNTLRWTATTKVINTITGAVQKAYYFTKDLDTSLNDIRIVTGKSADEMERFARQATNAAQALGKTTTDYTKASLLFYQQGLSDKEVAARTETTLKASNVTGQSTSQVSEQLTAVWNGYKVTAAETEEYVDKLAAVAASTASNLEELSTGMTKVASAANMMGVDIDQLNAQLSTIIATTRQAPETIGNALKTVYARMSTIQAGGIDEEDGATLKSYTAKMGEFGISVLDSNGKLREMGEVIEEIGNKWNDFSREAQVGLAQAMGGVRQYSNLTALFENWDKYQAALKTSQNASGTLQKQQEIYMDSISAHFEQLTAEAEKFYQEMFDEDALKDLADGLKFIVEQLNNFVTGIGGAGNALASFAATLSNLFSHKIGTSIGQYLVKKDAYKVEEERLKKLKEFNDSIKANTPGISKGDITLDQIRNSPRADHVVVKAEDLKIQAENEEKIYNLGKNLSAQERESLSNANEELTLLRGKLATYEAIKKEASDIIQNYDDAVENVKRWERELNKALDQQKKLQQQQLQNNAKITNLEVAGQTFATDEGVNSKFAIKNTSGEYKYNSQGQGTYEGYLKTAKEYYVQLQKNEGITEEQAKTLSQINTQLTTIKQKALVDNADAEQLIKNIEEDRLQVTKEVAEYYKSIDETGDNQLDDLEKAVQKGALLADELEKVKDTIEGGGEGEDAYGLKHNVEQARENIEQNSGIINLAREAQGGAIERTRSAVESKKTALDNAIKNQGKIQKTVTTVQVLSGAIRGANAALGGFSIATDESKSALERFNGGWEAFSGTITGVVSAFSPAAGLLAGGIATLAKGIFDLTGLTEAFSEWIKDADEKLEDTRNEMVEAADAAHKLNQRMAEQQNLTSSYQSQLKSLNEIEESWTTIVNKMNAGIALTQSEQDEYENIKNQLIGLNGDIVQGYDDQHNAIIDISTALDDVLEKLREEYDLQYGINNVGIEEQIAAYNNLLEKQKKYQEEITEFKNSEMVQNASAGYNVAKTGVERGQVIDITFDDSWWRNDEEYLREQGFGSQFDTIKEFFGKYGTIEDALDKITKEEFDAFKEAVTVVEREARTHGRTNIDDIDDKLGKAFRALEQAVKINEGKEEADANKELQSLIRSLSNDFKQNSLNSLLTSDNNLINTVATKVGTDLYEKRLNSGEPLTKENKDQWEEEATNVAQEEIRKLTLHSNEIETLVKKASQLELQRSKMTMQEYYDAKSQLYAELSDDIRTDTELMDNVFGKGNYSTGLHSQLYGNTYRTTDAAGHITGVETDLGRFLNQTGLSENDINISPDDYKQFIKFMQEYTQNPSGKLMGQATENAMGSSNWQDLWEGFQKAEDPNFKMFHERLPEITDELNEIKGLSLDNSALDEEKYETLLDSLDKYSYKLKDVETEIDIVSDKELYGTQLWFESLSRIESQLTKIQEQSLLNERKNLLVQVGADTSLALEELDELTKADYKILADIELQGTDTFNTAVKELENMQTALGYVGEEGVVAAENIQELISAFPELANSVSVLNDGTLKLTEEQIELIKKRTDADIKGTVAAREAELKAQLQRVEQEKHRIEEQLKLVDTYIQSDKVGQEARAEFEKQFLDIYATYEEAKSEITLNGNESVEDSTWQTANAITDYWVDAYKSATEANREYVQSVLDGNNAILNGDTNFQAAYNASNLLKDRKPLTSQTTGSQSILEAANAKTIGDNEYYQEIKAQLEAELQKVNSDYALIQGYMLELEGIGQQTVKNADGLGKKTKEAKWQAKDLYDIYHDINKELEFINQKLTVLQKKQKSLKDAALLKNLQMQTAEYEKQDKLLNQKWQIQQNQEKTLQTREKDALGNKGLSQYGIKFDKSGAISNYDEIVKKYQNAQNSEESVKDFDNLMKQISDYESNHKIGDEIVNSIYDNFEKKTKAMLEEVQVTLDITVDVTKARKKLMEFQKKYGNFKADLIINPDQTSVDANAAAYTARFVKSAIGDLQPLTEQLETWTKARETLVKTGSVEFNGETWTVAQLKVFDEAGEKLSQQLEQTASDITEAYQGTLDSYSNALDELNKWDKQVLAKFEMINSTYDHATKLASLMYGEDSIEAKALQLSFNSDSVNTIKQEAEAANEQVKKNWEKFQQAQGTGNAEVAQKAYDNWAESINKLQGLTEQYTEKRIKQLNQEWELAQKIARTGLYGGMDPEEIANNWDLINKKAETYLDTVNAQFGVQQLENKYLQAYNKNVGNTKAREKLNKIMNEELTMLKEKDKLTKYDLERANAKYDITLKQLALEEARENKTNLRLRRDTQGNYTYQYTANEDDILKAEGDLGIAQNNLYNIDKERIDSLPQMLMDAENEYAEKMSEIRSKYIEGTKEYDEQVAKLDEAYFGNNGIISSLLKENEVAWQNFQESVDFTLNGEKGNTVLNSFTDLGINVAEKINELTPGADEGIRKLFNSWIGNGDGESGIQGIYKKLDEETQAMTKKYIADIQQFAIDIDQDDTLQGVRDAYDATSDAVKDFTDAFKDGKITLNDFINTANQFNLSTMIQQVTKISKLFGEDGSGKLNDRIQKANERLEKLVDPTQKEANLNTIYTSLMKMKDAINSNATAFSSAQSAGTDYYKAMVNGAKEAAAEAKKASKALDELAQKPKGTAYDTQPLGQSGGDGSGGSGPGTGPDYLHDNDGEGQIRKATLYTVKNLNSKNGGEYTFENKSSADAYVKEFPDAGPVNTRAVYEGEGVYLYENDEWHGGPQNQPVPRKIPKFIAYKQYDTGGYTGVWGDQGRLAVLHEKELVLNKQDTENLLQAVDLIRQIDMQKLEMNIVEQFLASQHQMATGSPAGAGQGAQINQTITINADFPDATDRDEIMAAFDSLANLASQRAFLK